MPDTLITPTSVEVTKRPDGYLVEPVFANVDRPKTGGWVVRTKALAARLEAALRSGVVYERTEVKEDVNGHTYVDTTAKVMGRYMNADLKRLGY